MRICSKCSNSYPETKEFFHLKSKKENLLQSICKKCKIGIHKKYREENKEPLKKKKSEYYFKNREKRQAYHKLYMDENREDVYERRKIKHSNNPAQAMFYAAKNRAKERNLEEQMLLKQTLL